MEHYEGNQIPVNHLEDKQAVLPNPNDILKNIERNEIGGRAPIHEEKWDESSCPIQKYNVPETDIQVTIFYQFNFFAIVNCIHI